MKKERKRTVQINCPTLMSGYEMTLICKRVHRLCVQLWLHKHKQIIQHGINKFFENILLAGDGTTPDGTIFC